MIYISQYHTNYTLRKWMVVHFDIIKSANDCSLAVFTNPESIE